MKNKTLLVITALFLFILPFGLTAQIKKDFYLIPESQINWESKVVFSGVLIVESPTYRIHMYVPVHLFPPGNSKVNNIKETGKLKNYVFNHITGVSEKFGLSSPEDPWYIFSFDISTEFDNRIVINRIEFPLISWAYDSSKISLFEDMLIELNKVDVTDAVRQ